MQKHLATWNELRDVWEDFEHSDVYSETLPHWGTMRDGELYELPTPGCLIDAREFSSLRNFPTPRASDRSGPGNLARRPENQDRLEERLLRVCLLPTPTTARQDSDLDPQTWIERANRLKDGSPAPMVSLGLALRTGKTKKELTELTNLPSRARKR